MHYRPWLLIYNFLYLVTDMHIHVTKQYNFIHLIYNSLRINYEYYAHIFVYIHFTTHICTALLQHQDNILSVLQRHKSNTMTNECKSHLSTMLSLTELKSLKRKMPTNWVERIQGKVAYGESRIRQALRDPAKYSKEIIDAALTVADEYKTEMELSIQKQKQRIKDLAAS